LYSYEVVISIVQSIFNWANSRPLPQVRTMLDIYATIACHTNPDGTAFSVTTTNMKTELNIFMRKQLGLTKLSYVV
jgi:hypothetical protein